MTFFFTLQYCSNAFPAYVFGKEEEKAKWCRGMHQAEEFITWYTQSVTVNVLDADGEKAHTSVKTQLHLAASHCSPGAPRVWRGVFAAVVTHRDS